MKVLAGNPGRRPLNKREPKPKIEKPSCPKHLKGEARREWTRQVKHLYALGCLAAQDRAALAVYCSLWARVVEGEEKLAEPGVSLVYKNSSGNYVKNPWVAIVADAAREMRMMAAEFGFTPASRSRISVEPAKRDDEGYEGFLNRGKRTANG
jgi:P27 family predicted phage terminase small subunit